MDVVELFSGGVGVGKFCVRRRLRRGANFDLVAGFDLIKVEDQKAVATCIRIYKPPSSDHGSAALRLRTLESFQ